MQLLADRFVMADGEAIDLATGDRALIVVSEEGDGDARRRWVLRCDELRKLHHPALARLIDYGQFGKGRRFEAWHCGEQLTDSSDEARRIIERARLILTACGMTTGGLGIHARIDGRGVVVRPGSETGYASDVCDVEAGRLPADLRAIQLVPRRSVSALAELFEGCVLSRSHAVALWGPRGSGKRSAISELARGARLQGFVPIRASALERFTRTASGGIQDSLRSRSLFIIDDQAVDIGWRVLLEVSARTARPHVLLFVRDEETASIDSVALEALSSEALLAAVCPSDCTPDVRSRLARAAEHSHGRPGEFARLVWGLDQQVTTARSQSFGVRAAERSAVYGASIPASDVLNVRGRLEDARQLIAAGRHARGERLLRQAIGGLQRRDDWAHASEGSLSLAAMLLRRGRTREAQVTLERAADCFRLSGDRTRSIDFSILSGTAWADLARLSEAENVLSTALTVARGVGDSARTRRAASALARVLFWRGRYREAEQLLATRPGETVGDEEAIRTGVLGASVAVGLGDLACAVARAAEAVERAQRLGAAEWVARAACGAAFTHLAINDLGSAVQDVRGCVTASRAARLPLHAARGRLVLAEVMRRSGRPAAALAMMARAGRLGSAALPPIVRARCDLLREVAEESVPLHEIVARHVASTGLEALRLYLPGAGPTRTSANFTPIVEDIVEILQLCQTAEDETRVLQEVCRRLRSRVHAAGLTIVAGKGTEAKSMAADGGRVELGMAERAITAGAVMAPHRAGDRIEAAAPIRYGGAVIGAIGIRWIIGTSHDLSGVTPLLGAAAAAVAPILASALVRHARSETIASMELIGVSASMADVRRAIERAASAPFAVLIEGESGSGKELVARALHRLGPRRERPFCTLNCAALPDDLVEAELFGHARGAFTGAVAERPGVFEEAHAGTLLLDEIGELSPRAQAKILRVLQEGELRRVGENISRRVDVRIVAATNRDLRKEAAVARFRLDLLYRLDVIRILLPALRERREDIALLVDHFWREATARLGSRATLSATTIGALARYDWPGNVRELQNVLASLAVRSPRRGVVPPTALGPQFGAHGPTEDWHLDRARQVFEERFVRAALVRTGGHRARAAKELGVTRQGLAKLMTRLGIELEGRASSAGPS